MSQEQIDGVPEDVRVSAPFPPELYAELQRGRVLLAEDERRREQWALRSHAELVVLVREDLGSLWPFAHREGSFDASTTCVDYRIVLPGWPLLKVRYALRKSRWRRQHFFNWNPWAILPHALAPESAWIFADSRELALARAERVAMPSAPGPFRLSL